MKRYSYPHYPQYKLTLSSKLVNITTHYNNNKQQQQTTTSSQKQNQIKVQHKFSHINQLLRRHHSRQQQQILQQQQ